MKANAHIQNLLYFLNSSPTPWHATTNISNRLIEHSFTELFEADEWNIQLGKPYFVKRQGSICAFITPQLPIRKATLVASHTDSPGFKLKPQPEIRKFGSILLAVEVYGGPLITSWLNRDLGIAGTVTYYDKNGQLKNTLVNLNNHPLVIPQLAVHLDREVNEKGLLINKQEHLNVLAGLEKDLHSGSYLEKLFSESLDFKSIINFDLFLYPLTPARLVGYNQKLISSYRIDSLASVHAALSAFEEDLEPAKDVLKMIVFWDHEEIGSQSERGAGSPFFSQIFERLLLSLNISRPDYLRLISQSHCISVDLAHALHPNFAEKHDARHPPLLGEGIVLKSNSQLRYATDSYSSIPVYIAAEKLNMPLQKFVSRNDTPCGSTIGPIHASMTGMPTADIGCGQLSMHSARELMSSDDHLAMITLLTEVFKQI